MTQRKYKILSNSEEEFILAEPTFGKYEKLKLAQLNCTAVPEEAKEEIRKEFNIESSDEEKFGIRELYEIYVETIFINPPKNFDFDKINLAELNAAARDFFASASGL